MRLRRGVGNRPEKPADQGAKVLRARRRERVLDLRAAGATYEQIAREVGVSRPQVKKDFERALREATAHANENAESYRALCNRRHDANLVRIGRLLSVWIPRAEGDLSAGRAPDLKAAGVVASFVREARATIRAQARLNGAEAPVRHELTGADGAPIEVKNVDDSVESLLGRLARASAGAGAPTGDREPQPN